ncbi:type II toxin-antitoxin system VapC family toxin, partial [Rodentibacter ratti]
MKKILLDTNKIINILKGNHEDIIWFKQQYELDKVIFFTTPLIRHEVLRHYTKPDKLEYEKAENFLSRLEIINIDKAITDIATDIFRYEKTQ